jgi:hypothetical protein
VPPGAVLRQVCALGEHPRKVGVVQVALKRPAVGNLLGPPATRGSRIQGSMRRLGRRLMGMRATCNCPEQRATREVQGPV